MFCAGVGMHGGHDAALDGIGVVERLGHGSEAVGGAGSGGNDLVFLGQRVLVDGVHDGGQIIASGRRDDDLLGAGVDVGLALFLAAIEAGALQHDVHVQLAPGAVGGVLLGVDLDFLSIDDDGILGGFDRMLVFPDMTAVGALSGVILEKMGKHLRAGQVVDGDHFITLGTEHLTESQATDAAEAVNSYFHHWRVPPKTLLFPRSILPKMRYVLQGVSHAL